MEPSAHPPPTPEGALLRFCRKAAGMTADQAAAAVRTRGGKISAGYWRDVERGYGASRGKRVAVRASAGLLARMAREIPGISPERLKTEGARPDAAKILEEILSQEAPDTGKPRGEGEPGDDPGLASFIAGVREDLGKAMAAYGPGFTGAQAFSAPHEAETWDDPEGFMPADGDRVRLIARNRRRAAEWQSEERRLGLTARPASS